MIDDTITYPSIQQYRHVIEKVVHRSQMIGLTVEGDPIYDRSLPLPVLTFEGLVKLHGTNAGIAFDSSLTCYPLSRDRILTPADDNHGFAAKCAQSLPAVQQLGRCAWAVAKRESSKPITAVAVYGELCGTSINGKTAIGRIADRWVAFQMQVRFEDGESLWLPLDKLAVVTQLTRVELPWLNFSCELPRFFIDIDFANPAQAVARLEQLTLEVEKQCPAAKAIANQEGIGEGIVWAHYGTSGLPLQFKTKGTKHKGTKNANLVQIAPEVMASRQAFVDAVLTESRLTQGLDLIIASHGRVWRDSVGEFLSWIGTDVLKEESDTMKASGLSRQDVMPMLTRAAKAWYFSKETPL